MTREAPPRVEETDKTPETTVMYRTLPRQRGQGPRVRVSAPTAPFPEDETPVSFPGRWSDSQPGQLSSVSPAPDTGVSHPASLRFLPGPSILSHGDTKMHAVTVVSGSDPVLPQRSAPMSLLSGAQCHPLLCLLCRDQSKGSINGQTVNSFFFF